MYMHLWQEADSSVQKKRETSATPKKDIEVSKDNLDNLDSFGFVHLLVGVAHVWLSTSFAFELCRSLTGRVDHLHRWMFGHIVIWRFDSLCG